MLMPNRVRADPVELERALQGVQELRKHVVESLLVALQAPRQRHLLGVKLSELNRSIMSTRLTLSQAAGVEGFSRRS